jgi:hypothetical protein
MLASHMQTAKDVFLNYEQPAAVSDHYNTSRGAVGKFCLHGSEPNPRQ